MKQVFIDKFVVPKNAVKEFVQRMNYNREFIRNLPGFIQDQAYQQTNENGDKIVVTLAVWESEDAFKKARETVQAEYNRIGFQMPEMLARLNITLDRGAYQEMG